MAHVVALYRYPIKGFTPEPCKQITVLEDGRIAGDRVLGFCFANSSAEDTAWSSKHEFVALVNTPKLARLKLNFDHHALTLQISLDNTILLTATLHEREHIAHVLADYVGQLSDNPLHLKPERLPLRLVGDGISPRYQDNAAGHISLHSRESLRTVANAIGVTTLDERRFRSNIVIEGVTAWDELHWVGQKVRIGRLIFEVVMVKTRCLATHANPDTGERDVSLLKTLTHTFGQEKPTFAVALQLIGCGGQLAVGDEISLTG